MYTYVLLTVQGLFHPSRIYTQAEKQCALFGTGRCNGDGKSREKACLFLSCASDSLTELESLHTSAAKRSGREGRDRDPAQMQVPVEVTHGPRTNMRVQPVLSSAALRSVWQSNQASQLADQVKASSLSKNSSIRTQSTRRNSRPNKKAERKRGTKISKRKERLNTVHRSIFANHHF
jgi:hypothetical protein